MLIQVSIQAANYDTQSFSADELGERIMDALNLDPEKDFLSVHVTPPVDAYVHNPEVDAVDLPIVEEKNLSKEKQNKK